MSDAHNRGTIGGSGRACRHQAQCTCVHDCGPSVAQDPRRRFVAARRLCRGVADGGKAGVGISRSVGSVVASGARARSNGWEPGLPYGAIEPGVVIPLGTSAPYRTIGSPAGTSNSNIPPPLLSDVPEASSPHRLLKSGQTPGSPVFAPQLAGLGRRSCCAWRTRQAVRRGQSCCPGVTSPVS
jgi:hypothetical protein